MTALLKYDAACRALAEASTIDEVKDIRDKAEAMRVYARQAQNLDLEIMASEIRLRGERRLGELLIEAKSHGQLRRGQPEKKCCDEEQYSRIKLEDVGIDRKLSSRAQRMGGIAEQAFEAMVARTREQIKDRGSRAALGMLNTEEKQARRESRERILGVVQTSLPDQKFGVIVADPEWRFEPWSRSTGMDRAADNHYPTSCTDVIASRDVASIAAPDCLLALWATVPMLPHALAVMDAWGFDYRSHYIWAKDRIGTGYWNRNAHELLLIGVKGKIPAPAMGTQRPSFIAAPVTKHSAKPEAFLEMIEQYFPTLPKIELNRRGPARKGWKAWGNETHDPETGEIIEIDTGAAVSEPACTDVPSIELHAGSPYCEDDVLILPPYTRGGWASPLA